MRHPSDGVLRRLVDEPAGVADTDREHVEECDRCRSELTTIRDDAAFAGDVMKSEIDVDVDAAWRRLSTALETAPPKPAGGPARWRAALRSPVVAAVAAVALLGGATAAAAENWLPIFRTERVAPLVLTQEELLQLPDLSAYGDVEITQRADIRQVGSAAAAREASGLTPPAVANPPRGVTGDPVYRVGNQVGATFTFRAAKAARTAADRGEPLPPVPPGLDGSEFRFTAGPGVMAVWGESRGAPAMVVGRVIAPTVFSAGVPFETARDYLLTLPGLPAEVATRLRAFSADGSTLPLIIEQGEERTRPVDVNGTPATVLEAEGGTLTVVLWVRDGMVTAVAGSLTADEVLAVARELR